jgi:hypothetical protein
MYSAFSALAIALPTLLTRSKYSRDFLISQSHSRRPSLSLQLQQVEELFIFEMLWLSLHLEQGESSARMESCNLVRNQGRGMRRRYRRLHRHWYARRRRGPHSLGKRNQSGEVEEVQEIVSLRDSSQTAGVKLPAPGACAQAAHPGAECCGVRGSRVVSRTSARVISGRMRVRRRAGFDLAARAPLTTSYRAAL